MKKIITLVLLLVSISIFAQAKIYVHIVEPSNVIPGFPFASYITHPDLDGNPTAKIVVKQNITPNDIFNNRPINLFYNGAQWTIENSDGFDLPMGAAFNVFIGGDETEMVYHTATPSNSNQFYTTIDHPLLNGNNPGPYAIMTNVTTDGIRLMKPVGFEYFNGRTIYPEDLGDFPLGTQFNIAVSVSGQNNFTHITSASNIINNTTRLDHPLLNNNPDASFVFEHYYGLNGNNNDINEYLAVSYEPAVGRWFIVSLNSTIDLIPELAFDIIVAPMDGVLGVAEEALENPLVLSPNPVKDILNITSKELVNTVTITDVQGKQVYFEETQMISPSIDMSNLSAGLYLVKVTMGASSITTKVLK